MKSLNEWFQEGLTKEEYVDSMTVNKEELQSIYNRFTLSEEDKDFYQTLPKLELKAVFLRRTGVGMRCSVYPSLNGLPSMPELN